MSDDAEYIQQLDPQEYMQKRVDFKIDLYQKLSKRKKNWHYVISIIGIVLAALVPVTVNIDQWNPALPTVLGLAVTILIGLEKLFLKDHWKNYDLAEESLRKEKYLFLAKAGVYSGREDKDGNLENLTEEEVFRLFVERFEARIHEERVETIEARTQGLEQYGT